MKPHSNVIPFEAYVVERTARQLIRLTKGESSVINPGLCATVKRHLRPLLREYGSSMMISPVSEEVRLLLRQKMMPQAICIVDVLSEDETRTVGAVLAEDGSGFEFSIPRSDYDAVAGLLVISPEAVSHIAP